MTMQTSILIAADEAPRFSAARLSSFAKSVAARFRVAHATSHERRELLMLDTRMLADIGLTHDDVKREVSRSFWDGR
jgi:uncharacterized protein YjiS (DUF1127 family)